MTEKQSDSGSDSTCCVQDAGETMEEEESKWVTGDGLNEEHTVEIEKEEIVKLDFAPTPEANPNDSDMVEGYGVRFVKGDGLEEEATVNQDVARISWEDGTKEETLALDTESVLKARTEVPEEGDDSQDEEAEKKEAEEPSNTQPAETHNQLGVAQGRNALNTKTM